MTFSMALAKTVILMLQWSNFSNSCHVTSLNRECFPKCGKIHVVLQGNKVGNAFLLSRSTASLCTS